MSSFYQRDSKLEGATKTGSEALTKKPRIAKSPSNDDGSSDSEDSDSSEADDGGLVLVQKKRSEGGEGPEEDAAVAELLQKGKKKEKKMRITSDGVAAAGVATKRVFDEDGGAVVSTALIHSVPSINLCTLPDLRLPRYQYYVSLVARESLQHAPRDSQFMSVASLASAIC